MSNRLQSLRSLLGTDEQEGAPIQREPFIYSPQATKYIQSIVNPPPYIKPSYKATKETFWNFYSSAIKATGKTPNVEGLQSILKNSVLWLLDDGAYNPKKGLFFVGSKGRSKTQIMKALQKTANFYKMPKAFLLNEAPAIFEGCQYDQEFNLKDFGFKSRCFDDVGFSEPFIQSFGNIIRPIESILRTRYTRFISEGLITHVTTNLSKIQLSEHFDERILDRFEEMFNIVPFSGDSFRKQK